MKIQTQICDPIAEQTDCLAIGVVQEGIKGHGLIKSLDGRLKGALLTAAKEQSFTGKPDQELTLHSLGQLPAKRIKLIGLGKPTQWGPEQMVAFGGHVARAANGVGAKDALLVVPQTSANPSDVQGCIARGLKLGCYRYTRYKKENGIKVTLKRVVMSVGSKKDVAASGIATKRALIVAEGVALARDLVNDSPLQLYPETFAKRAVAVGRKMGLKCKVLTPEQLKRLNMNLHLGVGAGSARSPRLVHLTYTPKNATKIKSKPMVLVGKGITFDSGGLSLKPPASMIDMKMDMGGAASVLGAMHVIASLKPKFPVHGIMALAENMPSGTAIRPGDVITGAAGKSIEINNTDAEGRLVLADALHYATKLKPKCIIDLATLTGACVVALGNETVGLFSNREDLAGDLLASAQRVGESFWRMPLTEALKPQLKSDIADMKNTGERWGGSITAALFLQEFVDQTPWAHLDIAGPATSTKDVGALSKGGTGIAVATLVDYVVPR